MMADTVGQPCHICGAALDDLANYCFDCGSPRGSNESDDKRSRRRGNGMPRQEGDQSDPLGADPLTRPKAGRIGIVMLLLGLLTGAITVIGAGLLVVRLYPVELSVPVTAPNQRSITILWGTIVGVDNDHLSGTWGFCSDPPFATCDADYWISDSDEAFAKYTALTVQVDSLQRYRHTRQLLSDIARYTELRSLQKSSHTQAWLESQKYGALKEAVRRSPGSLELRKPRWELQRQRHEYFKRAQNLLNEANALRRSIVDQFLDLGIALPS
jgi:hypothetical protein